MLRRKQGLKRLKEQPVFSFLACLIYYKYDILLYYIIHVAMYRGIFSYFEGINITISVNYKAEIPNNQRKNGGQP
jgi:hypothetical protein